MARRLSTTVLSLQTCLHAACRPRIGAPPERRLDAARRELDDIRGAPGACPVSCSPDRDMAEQLAVQSSEFAVRRPCVIGAAAPPDTCQRAEVSVPAAVPAAVPPDIRPRCLTSTV
jgi:hypothetical protein